MKKSTYTRITIASLLTLYSFNVFAVDFSDKSIREVKKQESSELIKTSEKIEMMKKSNKKLKEKMDRICNADLRKKAEELKKKEEIKLEKEKKVEFIEDPKIKALNTKNPNLEKAKIKNTKAKKIKIEENMKVVSKDDNNIKKVNPIISFIDEVNINNTNQKREDDNLKITFGGVIDSQGYVNYGLSNYKKYYNVMPGKSIDYFNSNISSVKRTNPIFPKMIGNIGDYSESIGMISDAILHLKAESKNEDLGLVYGANVQFHIPVTEGKGVSQSVNSARGRSANIFLNSKYGNLKLGYQFGPESLMRLDATRIATVEGAADSDWFKKVNLEGSAANFPFYVTPRLYTESFSNESEKFSFRMARKYYNKGIMVTTLPFRVAYYSPNYMGVRFGISYSPRYDNSLFVVKEDENNIRHVGPEYENIVSAGASYEYDFSKYNTKVKTSITGEYGHAKELNKDKYLYKEFVEYNNLIGINFGVSADYKIDEDQNIIKFAASFAYLGRSGQPKSIKEFYHASKEYKDINDDIRKNGLEQFNNKNTIYWTAGTGYQYDNIYASFTYFGSRMNDKNMLHDIALGVQYDLSSYRKSKFIPYAALHYFRTDEKDALKDKNDTNVPSNQGILILSGVKFSF